MVARRLRRHFRRHQIETGVQRCPGEKRSDRLQAKICARAADRFVAPLERWRFFSRRPAPVSRKPFANGLLSI